MAAGTVVSRFSGYLRSLLLAAALGNLLHADLFTIGNTIPNMLYILLAGGVFNAVLVPQLVRAMRSDPDGGEAYTNRIITLSALFLAAVSVVLVVAAPWVMRIFLSSEYDAPELAAQRDSIVAFARFCLPQVFFYGMFALVGQVLNARRRFGPMMWAPIANNLVSIAVLVVYLVVLRPGRRQRPVLGVHLGPGGAGSASAPPPASPSSCWCCCPTCGRPACTTGRASTSAAPASVTPCGSALWTVLFVIVNQIAYAVVVRLASSGTAQAVGNCSGEGGGAGRPATPSTRRPSSS